MWKSLKNSKPHEGITVKLKHMITGAGAPEREGWESIGRRLKSGLWSIKQTKDNRVDNREPTHWDWLPKEYL